jgi:hypothetical protein
VRDAGCRCLAGMFLLFFCSDAAVDANFVN